MANTLPLINIMDERDKLAAERKVMDLLIRKFNGYASHTHLLNYSHMRKREFKETIESLIEREAIVCETGPQQANYKFPKMYRANSDIVHSWDPDQKHKITETHAESLKTDDLENDDVTTLKIT